MIFETVVHLMFMTVLGCLLGLVFFGGLWLTVQSLPHSRSPAVLVFGSVLTRTGIVLVALWYFAERDAAAMVACLAGFVLVRWLLIRLSGIDNGPPNTGVHHE